jgi:glycosyltransferase involved in cell wall biosynthesis
MDPRKLFVAYNALDTEQLAVVKARFDSAAVEEFRRRHGLVGKQVVMYTGRLQERKKPEVLVYAMQHVIRTVPQAHAVIVGDGPMRPRLQGLVDELGLKDHVTLAGAVFDEEVLAGYFLCSRAAVMPAAAGLSVQHAFGYGVPIILGDDRVSHGPEAELVQDGETGLYCRDDHARDFATAICRLLQDDELHERMSRRGQALIRERHNIEKMAEGLLSAVRYVLGGKRPESTGTA